MKESLAFLQKRRAEESATLILIGSKNSVALEAAAKVSSYLTTINVITLAIIVKPNNLEHFDEHSQLWKLRFSQAVLFCF